ncbi:hypothetical protein ABZX77_15710 [Streptomyces sp. NPDC004237]|uniref:hypothetical protein n=1 Tax=Streptomyces sp. NPDC004237 TaxID=3154455 RepID=UPI0033AD019D
MVLVEPPLDALDSRTQRDQLRAVLPRCLDQGVEHRDDGRAEDMSDAPVDAVVEIGEGEGLCG